MSSENQSIVDSASRKNTVYQRLQQREDERLANIEQQKLEKQAAGLNSEQVSYFIQKFGEVKSEIEQCLEMSASVEKNVLNDHFDKIAEALKKLQKYVSDSSLFLPSYDIRASQSVLKDLQQKFQEQQESFQPKKKFTFKSRKKENTGYIDKPLISATDEVDSRMKQAKRKVCGFQDLADRQLSMAEEELESQDVELLNLSKCKITLLGSPSTLHMSNLSECQVLVGPVKTSVFIDQCKSCTFVVACQQLRVHLTEDTNFYVHVTSMPIIEDCRAVQFAPYNLKYNDLDRHYEGTALDATSNNWNRVKDFNWLSADEPSPHWTLLPEDKRQQEWEL